MAIGKLRFGIVGVGGIGSFHAKIMQEIDCVELVAVADIDEARAEKVAGEYGIAAYPSLGEMLTRDDIQAVTIGTPSGMHADHGMEIAKAKKHVLSEKPLDVYVEKIDQLIATCDAEGVTLGGIFQNRFPKGLRQATQAIRDGYLGEIVFASGSCLWYRAQEYYNSGEWRGTWALDGGCLANQGIHYIDRLVWMTGMVPEVLGAYCPTLARDIEAEDVGTALLKFPNGAGGTFVGSTLAYPGLREGVTVCGTKGSVVTEGNSVVYFKADGAPEGLVDVASAQGEGGAADPSGAWGAAHKLNIIEFATAVLEGRKPELTGVEGRKAVALLNAIYEKAAVGPWAR